MKALEPQLVRIFYHEIRGAAAHRDQNSRRSSGRWSSRRRRERRSTSPTRQRHREVQPDAFDVALRSRARGSGEAARLTNVRWVTIQNEPNTTLVTLEQYKRSTGPSTPHLRRAGPARAHPADGRRPVEPAQAASDQRSGSIHGREHERRPRRLLRAHLLELLGHPSMEFRLRDVHQIVDRELPGRRAEAGYIMEFGVRGIQNIPGSRTSAGLLGGRDAVSRTNIAAFQQLWFDLASAQLGFTGASSGTRTGAGTTPATTDVRDDRARRGGLAALPGLPRVAAALADDPAWLAGRTYRAVGGRRLEAARSTSPRRSSLHTQGRTMS